MNGLYLCTLLQAIARSAATELHYQNVQTGFNVIYKIIQDNTSKTGKLCGASLFVRILLWGFQRQKLMPRRTKTEGWPLGLNITQA